MAIYTESFIKDFFDKNKQQKKEKINKRKYENLSKEEFEKAIKIIKKNINKYPILKKNTSYDSVGTYSTYEKYIASGNDNVVVALVKFGDLPEKDSENYDKSLSSCINSIQDEFKSNFENILFSSIPDAEMDILCIESKKKIESVSEGVILKEAQNLKEMNHKINEKNLQTKGKLKEACLTILEALENYEED